MPPIEISVVLATCSRADLLAQALDSILPQLLGQSAELIVVDDGSTDRTPQLLANLQRASPIPIHILPGERLGVAAARNLGARQARGDWIASFDDDQIALPNWLAALREAAAHSGAAAIGGALLLQLPPGHTVAALGPRTRTILGEHTPRPTPGPYPPGLRPATNNALIRRHMFMQLNGYDPAFTEGAEDADFFDRLASSGHVLWFQPAAQALHLIPSARLAPSSLRWTSLRIGAGDARLLHRKRPFLAPFRLAVIRLAVTLARDLPRLLGSTLTRNRRTAIDTRCSLWYTEGLLRALPAIFRNRPDSPFLRSLNFRTRNGERPPS